MTKPLITDHPFTPLYPAPPGAYKDPMCLCTYGHPESHCNRFASEHQEHGGYIITLPSGPPVRSDYERALERIRELETEITGLQSQRGVLMDSERSLSIKLRMAENQVRNLQDDLYYSEEERLKAKEEAGNLQLRLDESLARNGALNQRLSNPDTLAREFLARIEKMTSALDR